MKNKKIIRQTLIMLFIASIILGYTTIGVSQQAYPCVCRGGGTMSLDFMISTYHQDVQPSQKTSVMFQKAFKSASRSLPAPGECAWMDRPISDNEPYFMQQDDRGKGYYLTLSYSANKGYSVSRIRNTQWIKRLDNHLWNIVVESIKKGSYFKVYLKNTGKAYFEVEQIAPYVPKPILQQPPIPRK